MVVVLGLSVPLLSGQTVQPPITKAALPGGSSFSPLVIGSDSATPGGKFDYMIVLVFQSPCYRVRQCNVKQKLETKTRLYLFQSPCYRVRQCNDDIRNGR
jgi:hypothetical protein